MKIKSKPYITINLNPKLLELAAVSVSQNTQQSITTPKVMLDQTTKDGIIVDVIFEV